jgi:hypothetical protein
MDNFGMLEELGFSSQQIHSLVAAAGAHGCHVGWRAVVTETENSPTFPLSSGSGWFK